MGDKHWDGSERRYQLIEVQEDRRRSDISDSVDEHHSPNIEEKQPLASLKTIGIVLGIMVSLGSIVTGFINFSNNYVTVENEAKNIANAKADMAIVIEKLKNDLMVAQTDLAKSGKRLFIMSYEDQLDDINFKIQNKTATEYDRIKKERIIRKIESLRNGDF